MLYPSAPFDETSILTGFQVSAACDAGRDRHRSRPLTTSGANITPTGDMYSIKPALMPFSATARSNDRSVLYICLAWSCETQTSDVRTITAVTARNFIGQNHSTNRIYGTYGTHGTYGTNRDE